MSDAPDKDAVAEFEARQRALAFEKERDEIALRFAVARAAMLPQWEGRAEQPWISNTVGFAYSWADAFLEERERQRKEKPS